jgi:hypothetical protein
MEQASLLEATHLSMRSSTRDSRAWSPTCTVGLVFPPLCLPSPLVLHLLHAPLQLDSPVLLAIHGGNEERSLGEERAHLLEGSLGGLGEESPEEDGVGEVAHLVT